jgi:hypothetical protein
VGSGRLNVRLNASQVFPGEAYTLNIANYDSSCSIPDLSKSLNVTIEGNGCAILGTSPQLLATNGNLLLTVFTIDACTVSDSPKFSPNFINFIEFVIFLVFSKLL